MPNPEPNLTLPPQQATPHDSWAQVYEKIYEESFGLVYKGLTQKTLDTIRATSPSPASIIDFGAGAGRLSVPLSLEGYFVTVVESSQNMLEEMSNADPSSLITKHHCRIQDFNGKGDFNLALCVFTVILYLLDDDTLRKSLQNVYNSLRSGGFFLIDIPQRAAFQSSTRQTPRMRRQVDVVPLGDDIYQYTERTQFDGVDYFDTFQIRYWPESFVLDLLRTIGFSMHANLTAHFAGTGSSYYRFLKS